jgi:hypothetical protein
LLYNIALRGYCHGFTLCKCKPQRKGIDQRKVLKCTILGQIVTHIRDRGPGLVHAARCQKGEDQAAMTVDDCPLVTNLTVGNDGAEANFRYLQIIALIVCPAGQVIAPDQTDAAVQFLRDSAVELGCAQQSICIGSIPVDAAKTEQDAAGPDGGSPSAVEKAILPEIHSLIHITRALQG